MGSPAIFAGARTKFLTAGGIEIPNRTTAQRDALTAVQGQTIYNSDTDSIEYWDGAAWKSLNQFNLANRNYFSDGNAQDISKFDLYNDGGATPTDGIGGTLTTPNPITKSLNTSTPIISTSSYRFSKPAFNRQGEGWSITTDIALDAPVLEGEPITVQFRYRTSANYAAGDVKMFVYLVGPNTVQALTGIRNDGVFTNELGATGGSIGQFTGTTNATATTTAIRVIGHIASTSTLTYDIDIDEITIGTSATLTAPIVTEWVNYTPTITHGSGGATNYTVTGRWRRVGDNIEVIGRAVFSNTSATFSDWRISLPSGFTVDSTKDNFNHYDRSYGLAYIHDVGAVVYAAVVSRVNSTTFNINTIATVSGSNPVNINLGVVNNTNPFTFGNTDVIGWHFSAPVTQFANSTNIISSTQAQFQAGAFRASRNGVDQTGVNPNNSAVKLLFNSVSAPTDFQVGGFVYDTTNSRFVAQKKMRVYVNVKASFLGTNVLNNFYVLSAKRNGVEVLAIETVPNAGVNFYLSAQGFLNLEPGDIVEAFLFGLGNNSTNTLTMEGAANNRSYFQITEIPDLSVVGISGAPVEILSAESNLKSDIPATNRWLQHTGNSLTLSPGVWRVSLAGEFTFVTSSVNYTYIRVDLKTANGNDTTTEPSGALLAGNSYLNFGPHRTNYTVFNVTPGPVNRDYRQVGPVYISVTQTQTIFAVAYVEFTGSASNARVRTTLVAERIR